MTRRVELPPGSARRAEYDDHELELMRSIREAHRDDKVGAQRELLCLHDIKVEFGINLVFDRDERPPVVKFDDGVFVG